MTFFLQNVNQTRLSIYILTGLGLMTAAGVRYIYRRYRDHFVPPKEWTKVGELKDLICYPIKSCGPVRLSSMNCTKIGLKCQAIRDRVFMVVTTNGEFVTGRQHPKMVLVQPEFQGNMMKLSAPGMIDIEIDVESLHYMTPATSSVWDQSVKTVDCGDESARWFSRYILGDDFGLRLMYYPHDHTTRDVRPKFKIFNTMHKEDTGALHDGSSFMLFNESSVADLNSRLENSVSALNFRPNFIVTGPAPYEEDNWKWLKIGEDAVFRSAKPCTRCIFTNVNPENGTRSADGNPLNTLKGYRQFVKLNSPILGVNLGLRKTGEISIGDALYVESHR